MSGCAEILDLSYRVYSVPALRKEPSHAPLVCVGTLLSSPASLSGPKVPKLALRSLRQSPLLQLITECLPQSVPQLLITSHIYIYHMGKYKKIQGVLLEEQSRNKCNGLYELFKFTL